MRERFHFEPGPAANKTVLVDTWETRGMAPLTELLKRAPHDVILDSDRVQLAAALVRATLMHHSTISRPQGSMLEEVSFLNTPSIEVDVSAVLESLSIEVQMGRSTLDIDMDGSSATSEDRFWSSSGVRNQVLYRLG